MQSTHKIAGDDAQGFADYLTSDSRRGDYYLDASDPGDDGAAGVWHGSPQALASLGLSQDEPVSRADLLALMRGHAPGDGRAIRAAGGDGTRVAGIDLTFSPPKSVSALWAACAPARRREIVDAHRDAVKRTLSQIERNVALLRSRRDGELRWDRAQSLVAAQFMHTSSRLTRGQERDGVPDPQLHTHAVVLAGQRQDGRFAAVDSRELLRSARANGAYYRAALADNLAGLGLRVQRSTGRVDLAWKALAEEHGLNQQRAASLFAGRSQTPRVDEQELKREVLERLTRERATASENELRAIAYERSAGAVHPDRAERLLGDLERSGELVRLDNGTWTSGQLRERERQTVDTVKARAHERAAPVHERSLDAAREQVEREIGHPLTAEQRQAAATITGAGGVSVLTGRAGTGKGVVLRTAAQAWCEDGYRVLGTAVAGATAERLAADAGLEEAMTADKLIAQAQRGEIALDKKTVVMMDEAGMADTERLAKLAELTAAHDSKLVLAGDSAQLSPIGAGGLFDQAAAHAPSAELTEVQRARHDWEREAWSDVREGNAARALAAYDAHDRLHLADTREQAVEQMLADWNGQRLHAAQGRTVMLTDASNHELDEINRRAQRYREQAGELGARRAELPDRPYGLAAGDEVIFTKPHRQPGQERVENGTLGTVQDVHDDHKVTISTHGAKRRKVELDTRKSSDVRLAYAQHVYKAQGMTAERALVLSGGWQTDRERAYVALTRAREQTDIYAARDDFGADGLDTDRLQRLAEQIDRSHAKHASIAHEPATIESSIHRGVESEPDYGLVLA